MNENQVEIETGYGLSLVIDGWTNIRNESILDIIICTPKPIFYKSIPTGITSHSAEDLLNYVKPIFGELGNFS